MGVREGEGVIPQDGGGDLTKCAVGVDGDVLLVMGETYPKKRPALLRTQDAPPDPVTAVTV